MGTAASRRPGWPSTSVIVLFLATYGTVRLFDEGSGGGQGADPIAKPSGDQLQVQVIGQQWAFTYRFPTFGGVETPHLVLPVDRDIALHVTSLDVIHSFWAHDLGVKADANPGVDNVAYVRPTEIRSFSIRCAELCGLFHGHMFDTGAGGERHRLPRLDPRPAGRVRPGDRRPSPVQDPLQPRSPQEGRMNTERTARPPLARPDRLQPAHRDPARDRRLLLRLVAGPPDPLHELRVRRRHRPERHRPAARLPVLRGRLRGRARASSSTRWPGCWAGSPPSTRTRAAASAATSGSAPTTR